MLLQKMKASEVQEEIRKGTIVVVPIGSTEQHGPHLPLDTDIQIPYYIATKAAEKTRSIVAPPINYGYNEKELTFPGVVSVKTESFLRYVFDVCDSLARNGFKKIVLLNGHGWNVYLVNQISHMANERKGFLCAAISYWDLVIDVAKGVRESEHPGGMAHACEFETSIVLFLDPDHVDMSKAKKEISFKKTKYTWYDLLEWPPVFMPERFEEQTKSGVIGDPTLATREKGERLVSAAIERLADFLVQFRETY